MRVTCKLCGAELPTKVLTQGGKCPNCGRGVGIPAAPPGRRPPLRRKASGRPGLTTPPDGRIQGKVYWPKASSQGWRIQVRGQGSWRFRLDGDGYLPAELAGAWWYYQVVAVAPKYILVHPERPVGEQRVRVTIDARRFARKRKFPKPCGMVPWELETWDRDRVVSRIEQLVEKNDPFAWRELVCGYRWRAIRRPIEKALRDIGVHRALWLIQSVPGDWGDEVIEFLEAELKKQKRKRPPPAPPDWDWTQRPYWDD